MSLKVKTKKEKELDLEKAEKLLTEAHQKKAEAAILELDEAISKIQKKHNCAFSIAISGAFIDGSLEWKHVVVIKK